MIIPCVAKPNKNHYGFIFNSPGENLIYVAKDNTEFFFPMHKEFIKELDAKEKIMKVLIPNELLNLN